MLLMLALLKFTMHTHSHTQVQTQAATIHSMHIWRCCCYCFQLTHSLVVTSAKKAFISLDPTLFGASLTRVRALSRSLTCATHLTRALNSLNKACSCARSCTRSCALPTLTSSLLSLSFAANILISIFNSFGFQARNATQHTLNTNGQRRGALASNKI